MQDETPKSIEWVLGSGYTKHMIGDKTLLMDIPLTPSHLKHITYPDNGKSKVLDLGKVAIPKARHMDKVMLIESLGLNLMSQCFAILIWLSSLVSSILWLLWKQTNPKSSKALGKETCILLISLEVLPHVYLQKLEKPDCIDDLDMLASGT